MTIRRKLSLSFGVILALFGVNLAIYLWGAHQRNLMVNSLSHDLARAGLIAQVNQKLDDLHKQITLLSSLSEGTGAAAASPSEISQFQLQLDGLAKSVGSLTAQADDAERPNLAAFQANTEQLAQSWLRYYQNIGVHPDVAVVELALHADPLSTELFQRRLPELKKAEDARVTQAKADFARVARITDRVSIGIFVFTLLIALVIALRMWRDVAGALGDLMAGAAAWGRGGLDHRLRARPDEFGQLGAGFNQMAASLATAQDNVRRRSLELEESNRLLEDKNLEIEEQRRRSEGLLLNILPAAIAAELQTSGEVSPRYFEDVTILFTDFVGFTRASENLPVEELLRRLNGYFTRFDRVVAAHGLEKLKTIGDAYMCAGGIPIKNSSHPVDAVLAAFALEEAVAECNREFQCQWPVRIGIHTGPVAAGVVGIHKFAFDVWGDTVNFAARLEATGEANRINISSITYHRIKDFFAADFRGAVPTKEGKAHDMYFVQGLRSDLRPPGGAAEAAAALTRRYQIYFSRPPAATPPSLLS
jgi:class 3 adenylate cyclase